MATTERLAERAMSDEHDRVLMAEEYDRVLGARLTASDALAQLNLGRYGSLVNPEGRPLDTENLPYLRELRNRIFEWSDHIEREIARIETKGGRR